MPASERPNKPVPVCLAPAEQINAQPADSGAVPSFYEVKAAGRNALARGVHILAIKECLLRVAGLDIEKAVDVPADRRAEVIAALNALGG